LQISQWKKGGEKGGGRWGLTGRKKTKKGAREQSMSHGKKKKKNPEKGTEKRMGHEIKKGEESNDVRRRGSGEAYAAGEKHWKKDRDVKKRKQVGEDESGGTGGKRSWESCKS